MERRAEDEVMPAVRKKHDPTAPGPAGPESQKMKNRRQRAGMMSVARWCADVNVKRSAAFWDYDMISIQWGGQEQYETVRKVGSGKYSDVFEGVNINNNKKCIIKVLKPVKSRKIRREISILQTLCGGRNIVKLLDVCLDPDSKVPSLVFEYVNNVNFRTHFPRCSIDDIRFYLLEILKALVYAHNNGVMHRDLKPQNIMFDPAKKKVRVIDWGLAEYYHPHKEYNVRVASRYYKGPELLVDLQDYDYSLDMWSLGCILAGMIFMKEPMFKGKDNQDQLVAIAKILGTDELFSYLKTYGIVLSDELMDMVGIHEKRPWKSFITPRNAHLAIDDTIDLLSKLLRYDHQTRLTSLEAMQHPFFKPLLDHTGS